VNLLDMSTKWQKSATSEGVLEGHDRKTGDLKWTAPSLIWSSVRIPTPGPRGSLCVQRLAAAFVRDFVAAWNKLMNWIATILRDFVKRLEGLEDGAQPA
jgi:catalase-peroxidase